MREGVTALAAQSATALYVLFEHDVSGKVEATRPDHAHVPIRL
jgi:hypothetical protein